MNILECTNCGSKELIEADNVFICAYCRSKFVPTIPELAPKDSVIEMESDVETLLNKCERDPGNRRRYVNLILDIDPHNEAVKKYL